MIRFPEWHDVNPDVPNRPSQGILSDAGAISPDELLVGDPGIEPGMGLPGGVTVRCRTLQHVAPGHTPNFGAVAGLA